MIWREHYCGNKAHTTRTQTRMDGLLSFTRLSKRVRPPTMTQDKRVNRFGAKDIILTSCNPSASAIRKSLNPCTNKTHNQARVLCMKVAFRSISRARQQCVASAKHTWTPPTRAMITCVQSFMMKRRLPTTLLMCFTRQGRWNTPNPNLQRCLPNTMLPNVWLNQTMAVVALPGT